MPAARRRARRRRFSWRTIARVAGALALVALGLSGWWWWTMRGWAPPRATYPLQGVEIGAADRAAGAVDWPALKAVGADFAYIDASSSAFGRDAGFADDLDAARSARLQVGAVHLYDPCQPADAQAANFVTLVPHDPRLLPPAIDLERLADDCPAPVSAARVVSELMTFINQIEAHTGTPAILKLGPAFEARYHIARAIDRNLWLERARFMPDYAGRPFTLWTANPGLVTAAAPGPLRWVVVAK